MWSTFNYCKSFLWRSPGAPGSYHGLSKCPNCIFLLLLVFHVLINKYYNNKHFCYISKWKIFTVFFWWNSVSQNKNVAKITLVILVTRTEYPGAYRFPISLSSLLLLTFNGLFGSHRYSLAVFTLYFPYFIFPSHSPSHIPLPHNIPKLGVL